MPSLGQLCVAALALASHRVTALPTEGTGSSLAKPAEISNSLEIRDARPWDGSTTVTARDDPRARLAAYSSGQAVALSGLVIGTCTSASLIPAGIALPVCAASLILLALNAVWQTVGMYQTATHQDRRGAAGAHNNMVWYYGGTAESSFKKQVQSDYDQGEGHPVAVGHLPCDDGSVCHKAWYSYSAVNSARGSKNRNRIHITPPDHQWDSKSTPTKSAILPRASVHGIGADGATKSGQDLLYGGWIWEDADLASEEAMAKENAHDAADSILDQMNDQFKSNGFFGNTGVYCMGLKKNPTADLANTGYLWYYQSLSQYQADKEPEYMEQCQNV